MLIVILGVCVVAFIVACLVFSRSDEDVGMVIGTIAIFVFCVALIATVVVGVDVSKAPYVNEKIAMYEQENSNIEEEVSSIVKSYMEYEGTTFKSISDASPITLVTMFPELKSDALVSKQIEVYVANNDKIKELKVSAIDYKVQKWWLYFGN